jgi:AcrR family transcriptional regulator
MAYVEFARNGFLATKTLDIANTANVSHGTIFVHFPTKEDLLANVIDKFGMQLGIKLKQLTEGKTTVKEVLAAHLETIEVHESFYSRLVIEGPLLSRPLRNRIFMIQSGLAHHLEKIMKANEYASPIHFLLNSWLGLIHYYLTNRDLFAPGKSVIATCGKELLNHFIEIFHL